ncbi:uncharacterized protein LOC128204794 [Mya arenaria]|uniref:uncharacterized protein LOC128204794 n=1 Tax=Mya arenaria TaxID=6604 RepID=UPI0022E876EA|nr:uncharacterized protein LOC128204794 [Mya arenaria]
MALSEPQHKVEAAVIVVIDFGTTFCGYAFMFTSYPTSIYTAIGEEREPSCVLLNQDKNFNAFGKQAFPKYTELEQEEHQSYYFFHHFKMKLYESEKLITRNDSPRSNWKRSGRLAVMKGAVIMGMKPRNIVQRRAQFTYGFSNSELFLEEEHPKQLKFNLNGETLGEGVFDKLIERGQLLQYQQESSRKFYDTFKQPQIKQIIWHISLWRSYKPGPRYCFLKEDFCDEVGTISMQPPPDGWPDVVHGKRKLIVGETEFTIKVIIKETGEETTAIIDFL